MQDSMSTPNASIDVILQSEMELIFEEINGARRRVLLLRKRIDAGAAVEPGLISAEFAPGSRALTPEELAQECGCEEVEAYGLRVGPAESSYAALARKPRLMA